MKVLVGVASAERQWVGGIRTCYLLHREPQDELIDHWKRRGDIARKAFMERILNSGEYAPDDALLLLDADQQHPADMLDKLRAHDADMACGHYYRRDEDRIVSMCYELGDGSWPFTILLS